MANHEDNNLEERVREIFEKAEKLNISPSPFLRTRTLGQINEQRTVTKNLFWKRLAWLTPIAAATTAVLIFFIGITEHRAFVGQRTLVRVEVAQLSQSDIAFAEIELPEGVYFYSERYPQLKKKKSLMLAFNDDVEQAQIPVVIQSDSPGTKIIQLHLLDRNFDSVGTKTVRIRFFSKEEV